VEDAAVLEDDEDEEKAAVGLLKAPLEEEIDLWDVVGEEEEVVGRGGGGVGGGGGGGSKDVGRVDLDAMGRGAVRVDVAVEVDAGALVEEEDGVG